MKSMTGYGWAEQQTEEYSASVEIKGYNNRFLDVTVNLPPPLSALEIPVREIITRHCRRGRIELLFRYREYNAPLAVSLNKEAAKSYWEAAEETARFLGLANDISVNSILCMDGVLETDKTRDTEKSKERLLLLLDQALTGFESDRKREGDHTQKVIGVLLETLEKSRSVIASYSAQAEQIFKDNITSRFQELLADKVDQNRILAETAMLLVKYTIAEELSRMESHLKEFRAELERNPDSGTEASGKKLDFLCQEINREINTIGSKSVMVEISKETVIMKEALENIREQLRNVE